MDYDLFPIVLNDEVELYPTACSVCRSSTRLSEIGQRARVRDTDGEEISWSLWGIIGTVLSVPPTTLSGRVSLQFFDVVGPLHASAAAGL